MTESEADELAAKEAEAEAETSVIPAEFPTDETGNDKRSF